MGEPRFGRVITAMVTPFASDGSLDYDAAIELAKYLSANGSDGLVLSGTTGEGPVLSDEERIDLFCCVAAAVSVPVIAATGSFDTAHSVELSKNAARCGIAGLLVVTPYYNRPPQSGLYSHFAAVAQATELPVMLYDIPFRTGRKIASETILSLAREVPNIVAVKDAAGDPVASVKVIAELPKGFEFYSGDDSLTLALVALGEVGVVSVASHWAGVEMGQMIDAVQSGDLVRARAINAALLSSYEFETSDLFPNPIPAKAACRALGLNVGQCRLPLGEAPETLDERARSLIHALRSENSLA
jgi:4-hydroxy-tetrahydrodipicolinate synthase